MTKASRLKQSERMKKYWENINAAKEQDKKDTVNLNLSDLQFKSKSRVVDLGQNIGDVNFNIHSVDGKLKSMNINFIGGSQMHFLVEE